MGFMERIRGKKEVKKPVEPPRALTELEKLCGEDKETCEALQNAMVIDPRRMRTTIREATENAKKAEREGDLVKARVFYRNAGSLAIYEGNVKKAVELFTELQRISPNEDFPFLKNPEKAVAKAQEYYKKFLT